MQSDWAKGKYKIKNFQSSCALVAITFNSENSKIFHIKVGQIFTEYMYCRNTHKLVCMLWEGRTGQGQFWVSFLQLKMKIRSVLFPQRIIFKETLNRGFIFDQTVIAKSLLICIIPNHTIIRAEIKASVWYNCSFWFLLIVLKISTKDALVLSGAL